MYTISKLDFFNSFVVFSSLLFFSLGNAQDMPFNEKDMTGTWDGLSCASIMLTGPEADPNTEQFPLHFKRTYQFTETTFIAQYWLFADETCSRPLHSIRYSGNSKLGGIVSSEPTAREGDFTFEAIYLTVLDTSMLGATEGCGSTVWEVGVQQNISETGCLPFGIASLADYPTDHDIVTVQGNQLIPGFRTSNMGTPEGRPSTLQEPEIATIKRP
ncbi:MAG: hypothetical protein ACRCYY_00555 [Trueperaceae bacterium]